tara:strand:+ start:449 stop:763 length:315 start_codon:yes stop_codon:yes gene_type:complete
MVWYNTGKGAGGIEMRHLNEKDLTDLMVGTNIVQVPTCQWVLQSFVPPESDSLTTIVAEFSVGGVRNSVIKCVQNKHRYATHAKTNDACLSVESSDSSHVRDED